jgi:hypothetical protein
MGQELAFDFSDWIGKEKSMSTAPPRVHRMAKEEFTVPQQFQFDLLPSPMLSLAKILDFTVPLECIPNGATQPAQYFSRTAPVHVDSARDPDAPALLRHTARDAKFTFTSPVPASSLPPDAPTTKTSLKRAKGHPDAPTLNTSPEKHRIYRLGTPSSSS